MAYKFINAYVAILIFIKSVEDSLKGARTSFGKAFQGTNCGEFIHIKCTIVTIIDLKKSLFAMFFNLCTQSFAKGQSSDPIHR